MIELREITMSNFEQCLNLQLAPEQKHFVASNMYSLAEAKADGVSVPLAVYDGDTMVGFIMYDFIEDTGYGCISRLMIDTRHQGKGFGRQAMTKVMERIRGIRGARGVWTSFHPDNRVADGLYESLGFVKTGEICCGEIVRRMEF